MSKLSSRASIAGANLAGANLKATLTSWWDALNCLGVTDSNRTTVTASATLLTTQCGLLLVDCSAGSVTLTLPNSGTATDEAEYRIRRIDSTYANTLTVQRGGTDSIEGVTTSGLSISCGGELHLKMPAGSTNWRTIGRGGATALAAREALAVPAVNHLDNPDGEVYQRTVAATTDDLYMEDRWYALTQTGFVTPSQLTSPEDGFAFGMRVTQSQVTAQRYGEAQILEGRRTKKLRGKTMTWGARMRLSASANLRVAILAWTGGEDAVTSDVVNDWTSASYTAGGFFNATTLTVVAVGSAAMTANTARDVLVTGTIPSNATNLIVVYWTEAAAAQNVTLDAWGRRLVEGATLVEYIRRSEDDEEARCKRFYQLLTVSARAFASGAGQLSSNGGSFPVGMRATPTVVNVSTGTSLNISAVTTTPASATGYRVEITSAASGDYYSLLRVESLNADL